MSDIFQYNLHMEFRANTEISKEELTELGRELILATESFLKAKRHRDITVGGTMDISEGVWKSYK